MANNGITKWLTSAKAIIIILVTLITLVAWLMAMNGNVKQSVKQLDINTPKIQENEKIIFGMQKDISHIKGAVDRIEEKL